VVVRGGEAQHLKLLLLLLRSLRGCHLAAPHGDAPLIHSSDILQYLTRPYNTPYHHVGPHSQHYCSNGCQLWRW